MVPGVGVEVCAPANLSLVRQRRFDDLADLLVGQGLQCHQNGAGQQRGNDAEGRVLRRGGHEDDGPVLDTGQQGVLLRLREPVDLVEEEHGLAAVEVPFPDGGP